MPFLRDEQGRLIRKDGTLVDRPARGRGSRRAETGGGGGRDRDGDRSGERDGAGGRRMRASHLRVDQVLGGDGALRDAYEKLLNNPNTLLRELQAFLRERGHAVTLSAVRRHRDRHAEEFRSLREAARMAESFCRITRREGAGAIAEAAQGRFEMLLMQDLFKIKENPQLAPDEWQRWSRAVGGAVATRRSVEEMREEFDRKAAETAKAVETLEPTASNRQVVERVREILGMPPLPDELVRESESRSGQMVLGEPPARRAAF